jgi:hypothetical protein
MTSFHAYNFSGEPWCFTIVKYYQYQAYDKTVIIIYSCYL